MHANMVFMTHRAALFVRVWGKQRRLTEDTIKKLESGDVTSLEDLVSLEQPTIEGMGLTTRQRQKMADSLQNLRLAT